MLKEFKNFIMRGNMIDLAVAVVIGAAFGAVVSSLVKDIITPLIAAIGGQPNFSSLHLTINGSQILYGEFINALLSFLIIAFVIFFLVIKPINKLLSLASRSKTTDDPAEKKCPECLSVVPIDAKRCAFCTSSIK